jgi:hypothetical protein
VIAAVGQKDCPSKFGIVALSDHATDIGLGEIIAFEEEGFA